MNLTTDHFEVSLPDGWQLADQGNGGMLANGPGGEQLQLSVASIIGDGATTDKVLIMERLRANARQCMEEGARHCGLPLSRPLTSDRLANGLWIDEIVNSSDEQTLIQCAITSSDAVLLMTYATKPKHETSSIGYELIVRSVQPKVV